MQQNLGKGIKDTFITFDYDIKLNGIVIALEDWNKCFYDIDHLEKQFNKSVLFCFRDENTQDRR